MKGCVLTMHWERIRRDQEERVNTNLVLEPFNQEKPWDSVIRQNVTEDTCYFTPVVSHSAEVFRPQGACNKGMVGTFAIKGGSCA
eukprot:615498-Amphidinium_carterae.2